MANHEVRSDNKTIDRGAMAPRQMAPDLRAGRPGGDSTWDGTCDAVSQASNRTQLPSRLGLLLEKYLVAASSPRCTPVFT
ncbi:hypothetical protein B0T24DRAFT_366156 [Lasiosphaeria ovina]|uniref:Uncharacterized protein n=1 Tax=Lasiosphaeria ovina TaxID=92902 RepID=A0AAE0N3S6_9PEZI|nr:hypothetical protein B0T24DRAFT_366156 [Lasiosphaeria ovina]